MMTDDPEEDFDEFGSEPDRWLEKHLKRLSARDAKREKQREENDPSFSPPISAQTQFM